MVKETPTYKHYDFLIIGQGLAGSLLAWSLIQRGAKVCIIADQQLSASRVAAGLINPVTGQRFVLADATPKMLDVATSLYRHIEERFNISCFHPQTMMRLFNHTKEQHNCGKRLSQEHYQPFFSHKPIDSGLNAENAGIVQNQTAWLDTNLLLDHLEQYFQQHAHVIHDDFDTQSLEI